MSNTQNLLPPQFASLASHLKFALPTMKERLTFRVANSMPELQIFYDALKPRIEDILNYLRDFPADDRKLEPPVRNLLNLAKAFMEVSLSIELLFDSDVPLCSSAEGLRLETFS